MPKTDVMENFVLNHFLRGVTAGGPYTAYIALATSASVPQENGTNFTEVANANAYARQAAGFSAPITNVGANTVQNGSPVSFPQATGAWGTVRYFGLWTSASYGGGSLLYFGQLAADKVVGLDDIFEFLAGTLIIGED